MKTSRFFVNVIILIILVLPNQSYAGKDVPITEYRQQLISYPLDKISKEIITLESLPQFTTFAEVMSELYVDVKSIGDGQDSMVYIGKSMINRPDVGLKQGDPLVIRAARINTSQEKSSEQMSLINFARLERLRDQKSPITHFFPAFYGAYNAIGETKYFGRQNLSHIEMESADNNFAKEYNCGRDYNYRVEKKLVSDCAVFEFCIGEWAGAYFAGVGSSDAKPDNWAIKKVDYNRNYIIEGKEYTVAASEPSPRRIDVGGAGSFIKANNPDLKQSYTCSLEKYTSASAVSAACKISSAAEKFLKDISQKRTTSIFSVFDEFYSTSQCSSIKAGSEPTVIFTWPTIE